jgi:hypothetical protein
MFILHGILPFNGELLSDKVVQTELSGGEYIQLKDLTQKKKITLKEAVREAIVEWIRLQTPIEEDPLFLLQPREGTPTDSSDLDKTLYGKPR